MYSLECPKFEFVGREWEFCFYSWLVSSFFLLAVVCNFCHHAARTSWRLQKVPSRQRNKPPDVFKTDRERWHQLTIFIVCPSFFGSHKLYLVCSSGPTSYVLKREEIDWLDVHVTICNIFVSGEFPIHSSRIQVSDVIVVHKVYSYDGLCMWECMHISMSCMLIYLQLYCVLWVCQ